jgi:hypothetical protein
MSLPPHPIAEAHGAPFPERMRLTCRNWAAGEHATPMGVIVFYWVKYALLYIGGWALFVGFSRGDTPFTAVGEWAFTADAFRKAVLWSLLYESLGFGGSFGPMNARLWPPMGGALYFLRPGSTKLPLFPGAPLIGADTRGWLDVGLYAAFMGASVWALVAPTVTPALLLPVVILTAVLGVLDKTTFLAARSEHFFTALVCLTVLGASEPWVAACQAVWLGIWLWAGVSKMNHHFPSVIMVMMNNGPFFPQALKRRLFRAFPDDLRPSGFAIGMARMGTLIELSIPALLVLSPSPEFTFGALCVMTVFHGYIALNNPSGMPIEWNIAMVYGGWFLFGVHPEASLAALLAHPALLAFLVVVMLAIPAYGNVVPSRVSFLLAMRYYAGNWAYTIWLFRGDSAAKLSKLKKAAGTLREQLEKLVPDENERHKTLMMTPAHRLLHLEGRPLHDALPYVAPNLDDYEWMDGEVIGGAIIGWNFGDGHLNGAQLLANVQRQCGFESGELRVVSIEGQPLFGRTMAWQVHDARDGLIARGESEVAAMHDRQPWAFGQPG